MLAEMIAPAPCSSIPRTAVASLLDLAQQAFSNGHTEIGERLIDLVHASFDGGAPAIG